MEEGTKIEDVLEKFTHAFTSDHSNNAFVGRAEFVFFGNNVDDPRMVNKQV